MKIEAETKGDDDTPGRYLIPAAPLFLSEALQQLKPSPNPDRPPNAFSIGDLASGKSKYAEINNYPANTDIVVDYVFDNNYPSNRGGDAVTDARSITVQVQHSLIAMPEPGF